MSEMIVLINEHLRQMDEQQLNEVLEFLKRYHLKDDVNFSVISHALDIINERPELLKELAK